MDEDELRLATYNYVLDELTDLVEDADFLGEVADNAGEEWSAAVKQEIQRNLKEIISLVEASSY